jgi:hypothetical protein
MGTRIDIQVAQALLVERVREIAGLNREQRLERERKVRDEAAIKTAADKATGEALRNGQQGTGQLRNGLISGNLTPRQYEERLRAQGRKSGVPEYYTPPKVAVTPPRGLGWLLAPSDAGFNAIVGGLAPFRFAESNTSPRFGQGEGPSGTNAVYPSPDPPPPRPDGTTSSRRYSIIEAQTGVRSEPKGKELTFELLFKLPPKISNEDVLHVTSAEAIIIGLFSISVGYGNDHLPMDHEERGPEYEPASSLFFGIFNNDSARYATRGAIWDDASQYALGNYVVAPSALASGVWHHCALVQTRGSTNSSRSFHMYLDGKRYFYVPDIPASSFLANWEGEESYVQLGGNYASFNAEGEDVHNFTPNPTLLHGIRFTSRALYTGPSFIPPTSITSLA